jgi:hypothetical protein
MDHPYPACMPAHTARRRSTRPTLLSAFHEAESRFMSVGYLVLPTAQRVLKSVKTTGLGATRLATGYEVIRPMTLGSEDELLVSGEQPDHAHDEQFWVAGVPFALQGNVLLVGIDPWSGEVPDVAIMQVDEFRRLVTFAVPSDRHYGSLLYIVAIQRDVLT